MWAKVSWWKWPQYPNVSMKEVKLMRGNGWYWGKFYIEVRSPRIVNVKEVYDKENHGCFLKEGDNDWFYLWDSDRKVPQMRVAGSFGMTLTRRDKVLSLPGKGGNKETEGYGRYPRQALQGSTQAHRASISQGSPRNRANGIIYVTGSCFYGG